MTTTKRRRATRSKTTKATPALEQIIPVDLSSLDVVTNNKTPMNGCKVETLKTVNTDVIPFDSYREDFKLRWKIHEKELSLFFKDLRWLGAKSNELIKQGLDMLQKAAP